MKVNLQTATDSKNFKAKIIDTKRFNALNSTAEKLSEKLVEDNTTITKDMIQSIFESTRNSILEIFPVERDGSFNELTLNYAEKFAFIFVENVIPKTLETLVPVLEKLKAASTAATTQQTTTTS